MKTQRSPLKIFLYCDGAKFNGDTIKTKSLGGSETATLQAARFLSDIGNDVTMFSECEGTEGDYDGVHYLSHKKYISIATSVPHDVNIISRRQNLLPYSYKSKINILWNQDHAWLNQKDELRHGIWNCDSIFNLTNAHRSQQMKVWDLPEEFSWVAGNGIDLNMIDNCLLSRPHRDLDKLIYASRPERGLEVLITRIFPELLRIKPSLKLYITTYDYFPPRIIQLWLRLQQFSRQFGDSVVWLPPCNKQELYRHFASSSLFLYPTNQKEGYCIVAAEAMACGLPIITNGLGALPEIVPSDGGAVISGFEDNNNPEFIREFITRTLELLDNRNRWESASNVCRQRSEQYDWKLNIRRWDSKFRELISKKKEDSVSAIITTRNNEDTIEACLNSLKENVDEIVICDIDSTDMTRTILGKYDCKIIEGNLFQGNEGARNRCLKEIDSDWILWMNPDEELIKGENLRKYLRNNPFDGYSIGTKFVKSREFGDILLDNPVRIFRNDGKRFKGMYCERVEGTEQIGWIEDVGVLNTNTSINAQDYFTNDFSLLDRDIQKYPNRKIGLLYYMQDLTTLIQTASRNSGNISNEVIMWANKVIEIYQKHFIREKGALANRALDCYSIVNKIFANGIEVNWSIDFDRGGSRLNETGKKVQFFSLEDMKEHFDSFIVDRPSVLFEEYHFPGGFSWT